VARVVSRAPFLLSKYQWIWPLAGALLICLVGFWTRDLVEGTMKTELAGRLQTLLSSSVAGLRLWFSQQESDARLFAADARIREVVLALVRQAKQPGLTEAALADSEAARILDRALKPLLESHRYIDYVVVGPDDRVLASPLRFLVNHRAPASYSLFVRRALEGQPTVSRPFAREAPPGEHPLGATMFVAAPVRAADGRVAAVLGWRMDPEEEFSRIFLAARMAESGEAYAFDREGVMLTASRFDPELRYLGLIPNAPGATAALNLRLLDPQADLERGEHPPVPRERMRLTRMAASATLQWQGCDVDGYRNYRGVKVIGAWTWLPEYNLGVAMEVATDEAFETLFVVRRVFLTLFLLLVLGGVAIFAFSLLLERLQASLRKSAMAARRLGQYVLVQEIGRGANGMVYRARHTLLRRPVAIKVLSPDLTNAATAERFEQEAQMTSQLTHPNTVAIYDYGRTPEGLFYYAMEYLSGINLDHLVRQFGPQPEGRVIYILRQVCGSLAEAHRVGLIHCDIKPANILLTRRGGVCDLVKVLDFGLVKPAHARSKGPARAAVVGTPHFMSPEAVQTPDALDARSDLYLVGAVAYWLLTGKTLFETDQVEQLLEEQVNRMPLAPSQRLARDISTDLEQLVMRCLSKAPAQRPASADALEEALGRCQAARDWTSQHAADWWAANVPSAEPVPTVAMAEKTLVIAPRP
ncbi:MAG TPA: serine/threonine protein kinase, partial [Dongiaceae bacterium]|nr:serine/threonine protein kinase [Dongiaceae bacterium]